MKIYTLSDAIRDGITLSPEQQAELVNVFGSKCRKGTKERLARRFALPLSLLANHGLFTRVFLRYDREGVHYCAGQDYTVEVRTVRELVLRG